MLVVSIGIIPHVKLPCYLACAGIILEELIKDRMSKEYPRVNADLMEGQGNDELQEKSDASASEAGEEE
jgi:hypothetical protein